MTTVQRKIPAGRKRSDKLAAPPRRADGGAIAALVSGRCADPFAVLGRHGASIRAFELGAQSLMVLDADGNEIAALNFIHPAGFFEGEVDLAEHAPYRFRVIAGDRIFERDDPYRFPPLLGELDVHLISEGRHWRLWEQLGAHPATILGVRGVRFAVWAPNAMRVSVVGDFNRWDGRHDPMRKRVECGVWEIFLPAVDAGSAYKFEILDAAGHVLPLKADPFAFEAELRPRTASIIRGVPSREWQDERWMERRAARHALDAPISVYECHLGSWMRIPGDGDRMLTYDELGERLVPYVKDLGFSHLELLPVTEHPFDGSWGYQPTGLFAPTRRHGDAEGFARFIERCHQADLGVFLDWVPGHFPADPHGLARFDGTALYEHEDPRQGFHQDWNTLIYNYGRGEVTNFLIASALYWLDRYHIDGLRVDAVASMLYLDYSRAANAWIPNRFGGNENLEAISFLRLMNEKAFGTHAGSTTIAEESTAWAGVSRPTYLGGLGFGYKWNMGWMHDTLNYISREPIHRKFHQSDLTFSLLYAYSENFMLPLSHDEVVHGKRSLIGKMPGDSWQRFANLRAYYSFMWAHPGKKLLFMGGEFAQEHEWRHDNSLDWHLLAEPAHSGVQRLVRDLNIVYASTPALHRRDCDPSGFEWIDAGDSEQSVLSFLRRDETPQELVIIACNFTPAPRMDYRIGVPLPGRYSELINTDNAVYGGSGVSVGAPICADPIPCHGRPFSLRLVLPPLATVFLKFEVGG